MQLADFDFHLPDANIALRPVSPRDSARMLLVCQDQPLADRQVSDLPDQLRAGDVLVLNDTRVINARLKGTRHRGENQQACEATLHRRLSPSRWTAFMKPGKRLAVGDRVAFGETNDRACLLGVLDATIVDKGEGGELTLAFDLMGPDLDAAIAERGAMPLPPYIAAKRAEDAQDRADYQTVYARDDGSVAAPTAGLHFTPELMSRLTAMGVGIAFVTLHVGAGTFLPVKTDDLADHRMHAEYGEVTAEVAARLNAVKAAGGRIVCVGTTSLRLLESATGEDGVVRPFAAETAIFITPGYRFRAVDGLMTNFHLPKSTLFMLVCAFAGYDAMHAAYAHAIATGYRFYSYGDASLLWRANP
ncbi:MAG: tRNA preQ1(34) S-adenosylmethionine ribosyltransferase-isomerase QueA [Phenylobacterium sp.]|uniref:tRNA preQ1(34) S-adenosylmethionine ribosyltransferase-isomerase QueA n=1 Tax=Phenylobacterium sp. TaxID=1871053 RepID=UPI001B60CF6A|nr:tRNA preQ1(34) S-adenosylmethionine ribosyltransferase-isomerase QueA [Phenylobacterium sp.]MBP7649942.1 tRNA preQ1(34) S-adenosylmethionine ribosyltransferase-isomerase QueA [Phenylobacterium sp.]MBP7814922.1 tRNA preQ1(34) S-adenosylmethionine ribosyltransferase-isomerase QueA [Phenylobacterium sp.]MBP9231134.1 tRNA preQ1(34) S-adenosylmethionine ribosyltransferase-isomerase QueA [Phenylobacterium sp.]MBP9753739.1 tRNA preQ1(34) S-adenosylmethionine ribosyltransferase-isomerase QueA [Pheny